MQPVPVWCPWVTQPVPVWCPWVTQPVHVGDAARARVVPMGDAARARVWQLKQMRELQQEREVLLQGLEMMARGREWCQQQLQRLQERQRHLGQSRASSVSDTVPGPVSTPTPGHSYPSPTVIPCPGGQRTVGAPLPRVLGHPSLP